ncbi:beta-ribofuranosylaminobenzene 5'-phosphate synthase family protein [Methylophaga sp.]|uniref:beta-ribofuranosylaminobenzene 5'-phosphate synthase family protein n=1 Tax=Methylophaga sp. TaxID=2024840 RepID=UPI003F6A229E
MSPTQADTPTRIESVRVRAPARLHLGFLDLNASQGRKFGSIGMAIDSHYTEISVTRSPVNEINGSALSTETMSRLEKVRQRFYQSVGQAIDEGQQKTHINVQQQIPVHAGLGSGTQLALTLGTALAKFHGIDIDTPSLAQQLGRGKRSGIGVATFDHGGFVIDGGLKPEQSVPPLLMHHAYPEDWRVVLVMDPHHQGIHGEKELNAFKALPTFPLENARNICHLTMMQLLPALLEQNIDDFGQSITDIQALIGDHFAVAQGGRYTSPIVAECLHQAQQLAHKGIAQSSWGPTGCIFVDSEAKGKQLINELKNSALAQLKNSEQPVLISARCDNSGAIIETLG